jgi:hypothetical protein
VSSAAAPIPTINSTISHTPIENRTSIQVAAGTYKRYTNITGSREKRQECSWSIPVSNISYDPSVPSPTAPYAISSDSSTSTPYIISTLSCFNFIHPAAAAAIGHLFTPPTTYNPSAHLLEVACNATPPANPTIITIGPGNATLPDDWTATASSASFEINKADLIVRSFRPDYSLCFNAFQGWDSGVLGEFAGAAQMKEGKERGCLGCPFLRNVGVAMDVGSGVWNITGRSMYDD